MTCRGEGIVCIFGFKSASTSKFIGARNEMMMDDYDGQMIFRDLVGLKLPDIRPTGEEKHRKNLTQETCPDRGSNPGPLRDKRACYHLLHSGGRGKLISRSHAYFLTTQGHGRPPRMKDELNAGATSETAQISKTIHTRHIFRHSNKANMKL